LPRLSLSGFERAKKAYQKSRESQAENPAKRLTFAEKNLSCNSLRKRRLKVRTPQIRFQ
jgi:hypothetical protein